MNRISLSEMSSANLAETIGIVQRLLNRARFEKKEDEILKLIENLPKKLYGNDSIFEKIKIYTTDNKEFGLVHQLYEDIEASFIDIEDEVDNFESEQDSWCMGDDSSDKSGNYVLRRAQEARFSQALMLRNLTNLEAMVKLADTLVVSVSRVYDRSSPSLKSWCAKFGVECLAKMYFEKHISIFERCHHIQKFAFHEYDENEMQEKFRPEIVLPEAIWSKYKNLTEDHISVVCFLNILSETFAVSCINYMYGRQIEFIRHSLLTKDIIGRLDDDLFSERILKLTRGQKYSTKFIANNYVYLYKLLPQFFAKNLPEEKIMCRNNGVSFEFDCATHLERLGWKTEMTPVTGDFGADIIARRGQEILCIQCKSHDGAVGISAVQEVIGSVGYYKGTRGCVISRSGFTDAGIRLALSWGIALVEYDQLELSLFSLPSERE